MTSPQIIALGGGVLLPDTGSFELERYILEASGKSRQRVCFVPTASGDDVSYVARFEESYARFGVETDVLRFFGRVPRDLRAYLLEFDVVHVGGGNTRSMLAVWRHWQFDAVLRDAWRRGIVLCGSSAGAICWFAQGLTDSVADDLTATQGLGFLAGSNCPHYDGEKDRRPSYRLLVGDGSLAAGLACDDGAGVHFVGETLHAVVTARPHAGVYRVERTDGNVRETPLSGRLLASTGVTERV
ncbi:MAG: peptidase E [Candidatus Eremiobacteraeota bacterium]|nr:peptidase E [Candidatus Eremiobacteraeota bacterium]